MNTKIVRVSLPPFQAHELDWLCQLFDKPAAEVIRESIIVYAAQWREELGKKDLDKTLGG